MERYFDAHLYLANWGTHQLMLRLPDAVLDPATVADYRLGDSATRSPPALLRCGGAGSRCPRDLACAGPG
jgi:hypothetical protein